MCSRPFDSLYLQNYSVETFPSVQLAATIIAAHSIHKPRVCNVWVMCIWLLAKNWKSTFLKNRLKKIYLKDVIYNLKFGMGIKTKVLWIWQTKAEIFFFISEPFWKSISFQNFRFRKFIFTSEWVQTEFLKNFSCLNMCKPNSFQLIVWFASDICSRLVISIYSILLSYITYSNK